MNKEQKEININDIVGFITKENPKEALGVVKCISAIMASENKSEEGKLVYRIYPINEPKVYYYNICSEDIKSHYIKNVRE